MSKPVSQKNEEIEKLNDLAGKDNEKLWGIKEEPWGGFNRKGPDSEQDKLIDAYISERNKHAGEITIPQVGEWPPTLENFYGAQNNEWINTDLIRHYAEAIGDRNPMWRKEDYARKSFWGGMIAPATILDMLCNPSPFYWEKDIKDRPWKKFNSYGWAPWSKEYEWFNVMRPGDRIRVIQKFLGIREIPTNEPKPTRLFEYSNRRWFINQREDVVATEDIIWHMTINKQGGIIPPKPRPIRRLTDRERDAIYRGYNEERRRGSDPLFWEDIDVGEQSDPHIVGPISLYDQVAGYIAREGHVMAFAAAWDRIRLNFDFAALDEEINAWKSGGEGHLSAGKGHAATHGGGRAFAIHQQEGVRFYAISNWMGDNAFLAKLTNVNQSVPLQGDVLNTTLKVIRKYIASEKYFIDLDVITTDIDGLVLINGTATIKLPSRSNLKVI